MIIDHRTYTVVHGKMQDYLMRYERDALLLQIEHLGDFIGSFISEVGPLNQVVHIWRYKSMADREERRAKMARDPRWQAFTKSNAGTFVAQESKIMVLTSFSPGRKE
jgi:hypothetical protein